MAFHVTVLEINEYNLISFYLIASGRVEFRPLYFDPRFCPPPSLFCQRRCMHDGGEMLLGISDGFGRCAAELHEL